MCAVSVKEKSNKKKKKREKKSKEKKSTQKEQENTKPETKQKNRRGRKKKGKTMRLLEIPRVSQRIMGNPAQNHGTEIAHSADSGTVGGGGGGDPAIEGTRDKTDIVS